MKVKLEYIWLDGNSTPNLRSKTKIIDTEKDLYGDGKITLEDCPQWSFDGSSTEQAEGTDSDCVLNPVKIYADPLRDGFSYLVLCEVLEKDGETPHVSNTRAKFSEVADKYGDLECWYGFEQEYTLMNIENGRPLGFPDNVTQQPRPQGEFYCGVGADQVKARSLVEQHLNVCLDAGLNITGVNAEVMIGQWEYQLLGEGINCADDLWLSRYLLYRVSEMYNVGVSIHPKPVHGNWNGSGCHINFSTKSMREENGLNDIEKVCENLESLHQEFIKEYGEENDQRLVGALETSSINDFSWGYSDRGRSIRIPVQTRIDKMGYFEDRRPASNVDPYRAGRILMKSVGEILEK